MTSPATDIIRALDPTHKYTNDLQAQHIPPIITTLISSHTSPPCHHVATPFFKSLLPILSNSPAPAQPAIPSTGSYIDKLHFRLQQQVQRATVRALQEWRWPACCSQQHLVREGASVSIQRGSKGVKGEDRWF